LFTEGGSMREAPNCSDRAGGVFCWPVPAGGAPRGAAGPLAGGGPVRSGWAGRGPPRDAGPRPPVRLRGRQPPAPRTARHRRGICLERRQRRSTILRQVRQVERVVAVSAVQWVRPLREYQGDVPLAVVLDRLFRRTRRQRALSDGDVVVVQQRPLGELE